MTNLHGFELIEARDIPEINSYARLLRHIKTGAELLSLENDDDNKSFMIAFKTPPEDSTGLPHIMEHSVLCGSRKYPVKEPFVELLKTSLNTFLNAMTGDDYTVYPVASTNLQDFYNLVDVYLDAVFFPRISEHILQQEGWHYETEAADAPLTYKGVVFNEMKSAYSTPEYVLGQVEQSALFPDTPYANSSGGDPTVIPDLTFEQFKTFHEKFYHPSNSRIIFYGDDDPQERLRLLDEYLSEFEAINADSETPLQAPFTEPRTLTTTYDAGEAGADSNKSYVTVSWLLPETRDSKTMLALQMLSHILVETPASPLRKALLDSGLGEDLTGGFEAHRRQASFSTGLKGVAAENAQQIENLILETLSQLAEEGLDQETVAASLNTIEFNLRERNTGRFPRGLMSAIVALYGWQHGGSPIDRLAFESRLNEIKAQVAEDGYFENMIGEYFLNNPHRSTVIMRPDPQVGPERDAAEAERLEAARQEMDDAEIQRVMQLQEELRIAQETSDKPEDIAKIPTLTLDDLEREVKITKQEIIEQDGTAIYFHEQPTSGIAYTDMGFDLFALPQELLPYVELFGEALTKMGTESEDYVRLSQRIGSKTGGINTRVMTTMKRNHQDSVAYLFVRSKSMKDQTQAMLDLLRDILLTLKLDNRERFRQIVLEKKAAAEQYLAVIGHIVALKRIRAHFNHADWANEQISGLSNLFFLRQLAEQIENDWPSVLNTLETVRETLVNRSVMHLNATMEAEMWSQFKPQLDQFLGDMPQQAVTLHDWQRSDSAKYEGLTLPAQVNFVGKGTNLYDLGYELHGSQAVILHHLNLDYMWNRIRVQGGAYGGSCTFDVNSGMAVFISWRDPNIVGTLNNYDDAANYLKNIQLSQAELEKAIIGTIGNLDGYDLPDAKGYKEMVRRLIGLSDAQRQQYRDEVFNTTLQDFHQFGEIMAQLADKGYVVVVGSPNAINAANEELNSLLNVMKID